MRAARRARAPRAAVIVRSRHGRRSRSAGARPATARRQAGQQGPRGPRPQQGCAYRFPAMWQVWGTRVEGGQAALDLARYSATDGSLVAVADAVDRAIEVIGDQQRAVLHDEHVGRPPNVIVVLEEAGDERLHRVEAPVRLELDEQEIAARLVAAVPRTVARDDDLIAVGGREHGAGVEAHAERRHVRPEQCHAFAELVARAAPAELLVRDIAGMAVGESE